MGWFDEDDSEEEQDQLQAQSNANTNTEEEEDPLDAYMKSLNDSQASTAPSSRTGRLDMDNEDEATSHWTDQSVSNTLDKPLCHDNEQPQSSSARQALESTFHQAGGNPEKKPNHNLSLAPVNHETMNYQDFPKCFYTTTDTPQGHSWRQQHEITCHPGTMDPILSFSQIQSTFGNDLFSKIQKRGYTTLTLVQSQTLPVALSGHDALVTAYTGSGKTFAYTWPMLVHLQHQTPLLGDETGPMAIVLVPTRELAIQVHNQVKSMLPSNLTSLAIIGGMSNYHLLKNLKQTGCHVVVASPGRFLDLLGKKSKGLSLERVTYCVLDEADKMLTMGFEEQVTSILQNVRPNRQTLMLSATMGRKVERVAQGWLSDSFVRIAIGRTGESSEHVQQHVMVLPSYNDKKTWLKEMVPVLAQVGRTLVFVAKRSECEEIAEMLRQQSLRIETLHGEKHQSDRNASLRAFAKGDLDALVATDVAARGLDVKNVSTVINFDPAKNLDSHVHRIGRAGRLSKDEHNKGVAYTLLTQKNADFAHVLMSAFEREGREVTDALRSLAEKSRKSGNVASRTKWNKSGLGFNDHDDPPNGGSSVGGGNGYYGPSTSQAAAGAPPTKRSRWE